MSVAGFESNVFINCPFDDAYAPLFQAAVFAVEDCGFRARCSLEVVDSGEVRIEKINNIIRQCRLGIHDTSRTELDPTSSFPRFNMPLELGLFLGAKQFGGAEQRRKAMKSRYEEFRAELPQMCAALQIEPEELLFSELRALVEEWADAHAVTAP